mmetsp:Transcript_34684/g.104757  ORF Transcript_34684/g.104757 Transcript_34684/m.104757 type:complete len:217 (-) Transcript_34684:643-1293(-)
MHVSQTALISALFASDELSLVREQEQDWDGEPMRVRAVDGDAAARSQLLWKVRVAARDSATGMGGRKAPDSVAMQRVFATASAFSKAKRTPNKPSIQFAVTPRIFRARSVTSTTSVQIDAMAKARSYCNARWAHLAWSTSAGKLLLCFNCHRSAAIGLWKAAATRQPTKTTSTSATAWLMAAHSDSPSACSTTASPTHESKPIHVSRWATPTCHSG